jgi:hypothetical protein
MLRFVSHSETTLFGLCILLEIPGLLNQLYWEYRVRSIYERAGPFACGSLSGRSESCGRPKCACRFAQYRVEACGLPLSFLGTILGLVTLPFPHWFSSLALGVSAWMLVLFFLAGSTY